MYSIEVLSASVETGRGCLALGPSAVVEEDGTFHMKGVRTGQSCQYATPLHLAVRLELEANPGLVAITDAAGIAPGWSFSRGQGSVADDMPDMLVIGTAGGRTRTQALNIFYQDDRLAAAMATRAAARCAELGIAHGVATDEMRSWTRAGSLLWLSCCVSMGASVAARAHVLAEIDSGWRSRPLGDCLIRAVSEGRVEIEDAVAALGCLIFEDRVSVDFDDGVLLLSEPIARRRLGGVDRYPQSLVDEWTSSRSCLAAAA
ncbi:hypothetical protein [Sphingomonas sp. 2378]|uniref:hypothetical protein n=1 Tax=Sphingomonas sp. 2378 TaxID=1219748 RepID=UPI00311AD7B8